MHRHAKSVVDRIVCIRTRCMNTIAWDSVKREVAISSVNSAVAQVFCQLISLAVLNLNVIEII